MANAAKMKGDRAEREAVDVLKLLAPDLVLEDAQRMLGAGRRDDIGDLRVFGDVAIQVKAYANVSDGLRAAVDSVEIQRHRARLPLGVGMVPIPRTPVGTTDAIRWLAVVRTWPVADETLPVAEWGSSDKAVAWLRQKATKQRPDVLPIDRRVVLIERKGVDRMYVATLQSWLTAYRAWRIEAEAA